jgi:hypothetical protein
MTRHAGTMIKKDDVGLICNGDIRLPLQHAFSAVGVPDHGDPDAGDNYKYKKPKSSAPVNHEVNMAGRRRRTKKTKRSRRRTSRRS